MKKHKLIKFSFLLASIPLVSAGAITVAISLMAKSFNNHSLSAIETLATIPSLFIIFGTLFSSFIAKKIGYKNTALIGLIICSLVGIIPAFILDYNIIFISRALFGLGIGLLTPSLISLIPILFPDDVVNMIGISSAVSGVGGMSSSFIVGQLLKINWQASFLTYGLIIPITIIFALFTPTDKISNKNDSSEQIEEGFPLPLKYLIIIFNILSLATPAYISVGFKMVSLMNFNGYGSPTDASYILTFMGLGSMIAGFSFGKILKTLKIFTLPLAFTCLCIAMFIISSSKIVLLTIFGGLLSGFGFRLMMPTFTHYINNKKTKNSGLITSLFFALFNICSTLAPNITMFVQGFSFVGSLYNLFIFYSTLFGILAVISIFVSNKISKIL